MAFWGAPLPSSNHAARSCRAALECQKGLESLRPVLASMGVSDLKGRIGINSGPAVVGNMGSENRFDYTVMGDTVNLASRLEGVSKIYGTGIIIGEATFLLAKEDIETRELDILRVKGRKKPVRVYELLGMKGDLPESARWLVASYERALESYRRREFDAASSVFREILDREPDDGPSRVMLERCVGNKTESPPDDWDGAFSLEEK